MKKILKFLIVFLIPVGFFVLWLSGFFFEKVEPGEEKKNIKIVTGVETMKIQAVRLPELYQADGMITSDENAKVATKDSDIVQKIKQAEAALEEIAKARQEALAGKRAAEQAYRFAKRTYERFKNLYLQNSVSKQQLEEIETKMIGAKSQLDAILAKLKQLDAKEKQVKAQLRLAKVMLGYTIVRSPFDGYVLKKLKDVGDMATPGYPIFVIGNTDFVYYAQLDESLLPYVKLGQEVTVHIVNLGKTVKGKIIELNPNIDPKNRSFSIKVKIPQLEGISSGMYGVLNLTIKGREKIIIPKSAVIEWNQLKAVYKVGTDNIIRLTYVKLGEDYGNEVEVIAGLEEGDVIIIRNVEKACDGCKLGG